MQKYRDIAIDATGNAVLSATITVTNASDNSLATIYSDNGTALISGSVFTSSGANGVYEFYAADGRYNITVAKTGYDTATISDILLNDQVALRYTSDIVALKDTPNKITTAYFDNNKTIGSGADWIFTNTRITGNAGLGLHTDGYVYNDNGDQYRIKGTENNINAFGADNTGTSSVHTALATAALMGNVYISDGDYGFSASSYIPVKVKIICQSTNVNLIPLAGASFTQNFMLLFNSTDGLTWVDDFPGVGSGGMTGGTFNNEANTIADVIGAAGFGSYEFDDIKSRYMYGTVVRGASGIYADSFKVRRIYAEPVLGTNHQVDCKGLGDGLLISECHFPYNALNPGTGTPKGIKVTGSFGGVIDKCIGGDTYITNSKLKIDNCHIERAQVTIVDANVDITNTFFSSSTRIPLVISGVGGNEMLVTLDGVEFTYSAGLLEWSGSDISLDNEASLSVKDSYRRYTVNGSIDKNQLHGLTIESSGASLLTDWNKYSFELSRLGKIYRNNVVDKFLHLHSTSAGFAGIDTAAADSSETWGGSTTTYYYTSQLLTDPTRLTGRNQTTGEQSVALTASGSGARLQTDFSGKPESGMLRVYRGTSTGSYDFYVDIPIIVARIFYDNFIELNGFTWVARGAAGVGTINSGIGEVYISVEGDNVKIKAASVPVAGAWQQGDEVAKIGATVDGNNMLHGGWWRLTTSSGHNVGTDWAVRYTSNVSPAT